MEPNDADSDRERWWQWVPAGVVFVVLGYEAGSSHGVVGAVLGMFGGLLTTAAGFGVLRYLSVVMAPDRSIEVPPECLGGCCEGYGEPGSPGRYEFLRRVGAGDEVRCACGDRYVLSPDTFFGAQTMSVLVEGAPQPVCRKKALGRWRWTVGREARDSLRRRLESGGSRPPVDTP